ncbi:helix-turn-helix transcriptional regulator [Rhodoblastus sphagnicola]|nr:AraC family transcriptional regulator [Rhodoblastus sphagnicola]
MHTIASTLGDVRLIRSNLSGLSLTRSMGDEVLVAFPIAGSMDFSAGGRNFVVRADRQAVIGWPFEKINLQVARGEIIALVTTIDALYARAVKMGCRFGRNELKPGSGKVLDLTRPIAESLSRAMKSAIVDTMGLGNLVADGCEDLLLGMTTAALFPCVADCLGYTSDCGIPVLRRARDYIEAHATEVIKLSGLAKTLGLSTRVMQVGFKRHFGYSPRDFIINCRLERSRKLLSEPCGVRSITQIAFDCGFRDLSHFSAKYRDRYVELPSETMRASARRREVGSSTH